MVPAGSSLPPFNHLLIVLSTVAPTPTRELAGVPRPGTPFPS